MAAAGPPTLAAEARPARTAPSAAVPAEWETFDTLVDFQNLPRTYSCDELWYKFRDVLQRLGASPYMDIRPYDCGYRGGGQARSPHVEVKFQLARPVHGSASQYAQVSVIPQRIRLAPGSPGSLGADDCEFAKQLDGSLFPTLPLRVETTDFHCAAAPPSYALAVDSFVLTGASAAAAATPGS